MTKRDAPKEKSYLQSECDKVGEIAVQYGFEVVIPPKISPTHGTLQKQLREFDYYGDAEEKITLIDWCIAGGRETINQPLLLHYTKPLPGSSTRKKPTECSYGFDVIGSSKSTGEALLLKTALAILSDAGYQDLCVEINSIGDKESIAKYERELGNYFRKHAHEISSKLRQEFKKNHYALIKDNEKESDTIRHSIPQSISFLSDLSRMHFKEVLEYLEAFEVMYKITPTLLGNRSYASHTVFEIRDSSAKSDGKILAYGYRYNYLAKKLGAKKDIPAVGMSLTLKKNPALSKKVILKNIKKPRFYLAQLGSTAKLKALNVVEMLRTHKIPVYHSLTKDKITGQLSGAEYMHATHVIIIGQKEAIENTVVVRNITNREQETVPLKDLPHFLHTLTSPASPHITPAKKVKQ